jgi:hypothetical protein
MQKFKHLVPIAGSMAGAWLVGTTGAVALVRDTGGTFLVFLLAVVVVTAGFARWWHLMVRQQAPRQELRIEVPPYVLPQDIDALLDQQLQCVNAFLDTARTIMDVDGRLRGRMRGLSGYITSIEDELEQLRVEANKVEEIKQVAARTPRLMGGKPDDYGLRRKAASDDVPEFLTKREPSERTETAADWLPELAQQAPAE